MIPLALSSGITIRVSHALGAGNSQAARFSGAFGILVCAAFMSCSAVCYGHRHQPVAGCGNLPGRGWRADWLRRCTAWIQGHPRSNGDQHLLILGARVSARLPGRRHLQAGARVHLGRLHCRAVGRRCVIGLALCAPFQECAYAVGLIFAFRRNRLVGSYLFLTSTSRG